MSLTPPQNAVYQYTKDLSTLLYIYGYPLVRQWQIMANFINDPTKKPFNELFYAGLTSPSYQPFPGANVDTYYSLAWLDLTNTPILLSTPNSINDNRWWSVLLVDVFTDVITNVPNLDKNVPPMKTIIVGPNNYDLFKHDPPGINIVKAPSNIVWLISRVEIQNNDVNEASIFAHKITIQDVFPNAPVLHIDPIDNSIYTSMTFYTILSGLLMYNNPPVEETVLFDQFATIGFTYKTLFAPPAVGSPAYLGYMDAIPIALNQIIPFGAQYSSGLVVSNFWNAGTKAGVYGDDYIRRAYSSFVANFGGNVVTQQFYAGNGQSSTGTGLNGNNSYVIHFNANQLPDLNPLWGFFSIAAYLLPALNLYPNPYDKYSIKSDNSDVHYNPDGSLDVYLQHNPPVDPALFANWIPVPLAPFYLVARFYAASTNFVNNFYMPPVTLSTPV
jgi:hypothetical protein